MHSVYVYYRIDLAQVELATIRIDALQHELAAHCSLPPRRLSRCDDATTWMEIYEHIVDYERFTLAHDTAVELQRCEEFTLGERHLECFTAPSARHVP